MDSTSEGEGPKQKKISPRLLPAALKSPVPGASSLQRRCRTHSRSSVGQLGIQHTHAPAPAPARGYSTAAWLHAVARPCRELVTGKQSCRLASTIPPSSLLAALVLPAICHPFSSLLAALVLPALRLLPLQRYAGCSHGVCHLGEELRALNRTLKGWQGCTAKGGMRRVHVNERHRGGYTQAGRGCR